ncbi:F5/8 type C domain protein [Planctomycetes bacterium Poly30]|uniref:F5/8 type C domain protein n=1 Tax=Saltatorellus ferox TaxID=2528018 RepID=A0A518EVG0_9BACT|nr:F5/8 type C domain protein [Planctomycetes bacterium Poly30]
MNALSVTALFTAAAFAGLGAESCLALSASQTSQPPSPEAPPARVVPRLLSATATASSTGASGPASFAVDGNQATRWESVHGIDPSILTLDLGGSYAVTGAAIYWEAANAGTYSVDGSVDGVNWVTIRNRTGGQFGDRKDRLKLGGVYRYVRMNGMTRSPGNVYGYSIWEMEVYGTDAVDSDGDGVDDTVDQCPGTPPGTTVDATGCEVVIPVQEVSFANGRLVGGSGSASPEFTLYVFDGDLGAAGTSACNGGCAQAWPPLYLEDGVPTGLPGLGSITRADGTFQVTYQDRPLYFYSGDQAPGETMGEGLGGVWSTVPFVQVFAPLYDSSTVLEPALQEDTPTALITRFGDRARDRHAREDQFQSYDHYLSFYWEHRTADVEVVDTIGKGGTTITFNVATQWQLSPNQAELRFLYRGFNTVAEYYNNGTMTSVPSLDVPGSNVKHYTRTIDFNQKTGQPLRVGDRLEFELSHFLDAVPNGRNNYYGTAILYIVGQGVVPWEARGVFGNPATEREDSYPMPVEGWLGGGTTLPYQYSDEPDNHFMQMSTNIAGINAQPFVLGRRVHHSDFGNGSHDEGTSNPPFLALSNTLGPQYMNRSCVGCHDRNSRALPASVGESLSQYVIRVGDANGDPHPALGSILQPRVTSGVAEAGITLAAWQPVGSLRKPVYAFSGVTPQHFSTRLAPQIVGMGLLEAIQESDVEALSDPDDLDGDGISGRMRLVTDSETGQIRLGRFGWKANEPSVRHQIAAAFNGDMGVMTSIRPEPDCGSAQLDCGPSGAEIDDIYVEQLTAYVSLLGVSARRDLADPLALAGEALFTSAGCVKCHVPTFETTPYHPHAELRSQTIHPYTDLLLHDMGPGLASTLIEGNATASEWRTAPLWNVGLTADVSGGEGYLHDGRAETLEDAILWHGGEAEAAKVAYQAMSGADQVALLTFLRSL